MRAWAQILGGAALVSVAWHVGAALEVKAARHKVEARDAATEKQLQAAGARLIADYGGFRLYDSPVTLRGTETRDVYNRIFLNAGALDTSRAEVQAQRRAAGVFAGRRLRLVQFAGPVKPEWRKHLEEMGAKVVCYIPENAYLIYGDESALARMHRWAASAPEAQWEGEYRQEYKLQPAEMAAWSKAGADGRGLYAAQLVADPEANAETLRLISELAPGGIVRQHRVLDYVDVRFRLGAADVEKVAARQDVIAIRSWTAPRKNGERQDQIMAGNMDGSDPTAPVQGMGYLDWLASKGFTQAQFDASGFAVDITDSGVDNGTAYPNHFGLYEGGLLGGTSHVIYNRLEGTANQPGSTLAGCDGHGTINAHIVGGYDQLSGAPFADAAGFHYGLGVCPFVRMGSSVVFDPEYWTSPDYTTLEGQAYHDGARISNNSWGDDTSRGVYNEESQEFDALVRDAQPAGSAYGAAGNQEMVIVFSAGNVDQEGNGMDSPGGTAKNVISVGASDNVQPFNEGTGADVDALDADQIAGFSAQGPCGDGRQKPDLVAPGSHISGGAPESATPGPTGTADPCFFTYGAEYGYSITGTPDGPFFPNNQQYYVVSDGTSHSAPAVAGACALLRQYFLNQGWAAPSPAMTKAFLMNSARYLTGTTADDTLWSPKQGMGEVDLGAAFDGGPRVLRDELPEDIFTASGQTRTFNAAVADPSQPLRITVGWTDAPGSVTGAAYNNDLDLTVSAGGQVYKGNVFSGRWSTSGGTADFRNNVESVFLPPGASGSFTVTITAANINSIGVPNTNNALEQDFALVMDNAAAGGEPRNIVLLNPQVAGGTFVFSFQTESNRTYRVQYASGLNAGGGWASLPAITGDGSVISVTNAMTEGQRYYRVASP